MSKRELPQTEEEKLPCANSTKKIRNNDSQEASVNSSLSPSKQRQTRSTNAFRINTPSNKPAQESDDESKDTIILDKKVRVTELVLDSDSDASYYSQDEEATTTNQSIQRVNLKRMPNVMFYLNILPSQPQGDLLKNIHKLWFKDYKKLEIHHGYIQWLFPNFFVTAYNRDAHKLTASEAKIFRENEEIAERLVKSYTLFLDFLGIRLADKMTGKLERAHNFEERYKATLTINSNNHTRVKRLLAHLNVVGLRQYAIQLVNFLEVEIYGEIGGYNKYLKQPQPIKGEYLRSVRINPLFALIKYEVFKDWKAYGQANTPEEKELLYKCCSTSDENDFEPSVLFK